ncbi:hypothetical protein JANAI62_03170 [Jannaschia pagri]|uniref:Uncharacterized protein n=1 Tax=Jannaschia pagri TaxID=2829797 RepID=A0ABQ4NGZ0_9RHOB|nr:MULTISPECIES: hypothetical protein [unclassified Jannaschia]GIT90200.1 hypothetical protein JANAI61_06580 [Jannaschia sp. AI_61]GIT93694.1 hypothetical protein JANAI62_03170 [Jannaschia sp. AI_62]
MSIARLEGNASCSSVSANGVAALGAAGEAEGLTIARYDRWVGCKPTREEAPGDPMVGKPTGKTDGASLQAFEKTAMGDGVLPPALALPRGEPHPALCLIARDRSGVVVFCPVVTAYLPSDDLMGCTDRR